MATISQIRGMMLEEAILRLLQASGYVTIEDAANDPTLHNGPAGLEVLGRGCKHQLDAIADPKIMLPFTNPQRLVIEAKCYAIDNPIGLSVIRNAVGVLKDISEYWIPPTTAGRVSTQRYHYQYSVFSASGYTSEAERYAFAQDIFLIQTQKSSFFNPVLKSIRGISHHDFGASSFTDIQIDMGLLRRQIRNLIRNHANSGLNVNPNAKNKILSYLDDLERIGWTLLGVIARRFPIHLVPAPGIDFLDLRDEILVRIMWDDESWYIDDQTGRTLFSFDLPIELFNLYADSGVLSNTQALNLKAETMNEIQATAFFDGRIKFFNFKLDLDWLTRVRQRTEDLSQNRKK